MPARWGAAAAVAFATLACSVSLVLPPCSEKFVLGLGHRLKYEAAGLVENARHDDFQAIETLLPETAVVLHPVSDVFEWTRLDPAGPPLGFAATGDQTGVLEHLEVFGDGGHAHSKGGGQFGDRGVACDQARKDRVAGGIGESREGGAQVAGWTPKPP